MRRLSALALLLMLSACSTEVEKPYFKTTGVRTPLNTACTANPTSFGEAEPIEDITVGNGCGIRDGYKISTMDDVSFSQPAIVNCSTANTFHDWLQNSVQPRAQDAYGERVVAVKIAASYACRPRNNQRGAKLSEHGMGNAIDVAGFTLASGREVTVLGDYYGKNDSRAFLRSVRADACGPFHTVLGPGSDANHKDHLHLDLQRKRSGGAYCH
jgi:hypothetical protein